MGTEEPAKQMARPPSVDDLFDPMWRLEMHSHGDDEGTPSGSPHKDNPVGAKKPAVEFRAADEQMPPPVRGGLSTIAEVPHQEEGLSGANAKDAAVKPPRSPDFNSRSVALGGKPKSEPGVGMLMGPPSARQAKGYSRREEGGMSVLNGPGGFGGSLEGELFAALKKEPFDERSPDPLDDPLKSNPTSDDEHLEVIAEPAEHAMVDERKQKRMLSNRESARRSRLRKQQHLDELRAYVAQLRAENTHMLNKFNIAARHYTQLTEENRMLQHHAMDLSRTLQRLHHAAAAAGPAGLHAMTAIRSMAGFSGMGDYGGHLSGNMAGMGSMHNHLGGTFSGPVAGLGMHSIPGSGGLNPRATVGGSLGINGQIGGAALGGGNLGHGRDGGSMSR